MRIKFFDRALSVVLCICLFVSVSSCSTESQNGNPIESTTTEDVFSDDFLTKFVSELEFVIEEMIATDNFDPVEVNKIIQTRGYYAQTRNAGYEDIDYATAKDVFVKQYSEELYAFIESKFLSDSFSILEMDGIMDEASLLFSSSECDVIRLLVNGVDVVYDTLMEYGYAGAVTRGPMACKIILGLGGSYCGWLWGAAIGGPAGAVVGGVLWTVASVYASEAC